MNQDEWGRNGLNNSDRRRRGIARAVPLPADHAGDSLALMVLVISAAIAVVACTIATNLF